MSGDSTENADRRATLADARADWPTVTLDDATFERYLADKSIERDGITHLTDLFLACACCLDVPGARLVFEEHFVPQMRSAIARVPEVADVDDVLQRVRVRLFTVTEQRGAKLENYRGEGPLAGWLRTTAVRQALESRPTRRTEEVTPRALEALVDALPNPELAFLKGESTRLLKQAFAKAIDDLEPRQRTWLRLAVIEGLSIDQLAPMYGVHRTTAARWLTATRERLSALTLQHLRESAKLDSGELESLLGHARSHLDVSLERLLVTKEPP